MRISLLLLLALSASAPCLRAQDAATDGARPDTAPLLSLGSFLRDDPAVGDARMAPLPLPPSDNDGLPHRSPALAGVLSLAVPGAGQVYTGSWWTAALWVSLEAAGWALVISNNHKGDEATAEYQDYADTHWSAVKYSEWLNENAKDFPGGENAVYIEINPDATLPSWERVNWDQMNTTEMAIPVFSHRLPPHGEQQYFELIGKYNQYSYGWDDKLSGSYFVAPPNMLSYADMRGTANDYYNAADTFLSLIIVNHLLSAAEAVWSAARFNNAVRLRARVEPHLLPDGRVDLMPTARFAVRL